MQRPTTSRCPLKSHPRMPFRAQNGICRHLELSYVASAEFQSDLDARPQTQHGAKVRHQEKARHRYRTNCP